MISSQNNERNYRTKRHEQVSNHLKFFSIRPPFIIRIYSDLCLFFITVSIISLMMMIGTLLGGFVTEQFGCLQCLRISLLLEMAGWASIFWAKNFTELMVGRVLTGTYFKL